MESAARFRFVRRRQQTHDFDRRPIDRLDAARHPREDDELGEGAELDRALADVRGRVPADAEDDEQVTRPGSAR